MEQWRRLTHFKNGKYNNYFVSNYGRVKNENNNILFTFLNFGYVQVFLWHNGKSYCAKMHRLVASEFLTDSPYYGLSVNHKDKNKTNNYVSNLEWCTQRYNNEYGTLQYKANRTKKKKGIIKDTYVYNFKNYVLYKFYSLTSVAKYFNIPLRLVWAVVSNERNQTENLIISYNIANIPKKVTMLNQQPSFKKNIQIQDSFGNRYLAYGYEEAVCISGVSKCQVSALLNKHKKVVKGYKMKYIPYKYNPKEFKVVTPKNFISHTLKEV